jgi:hypothetical protein
MTRAPLLVPAGLLLLALAGCSASPAADAKVGPTPTPSSTLVTETLPLGFPSKEVPLLDGPILHVSHPGNIWAAWVYSEDLPGDLAKATTQLTAAGYEQTNAGEGWADFHGLDYEVRVVGLVDDKFGSSLAYTIAEKTGN